MPDFYGFPIVFRAFLWHFSMESYQNARIMITCLFYCINICRVPRKIFEHEVTLNTRPMSKQLLWDLANVNAWTNVWSLYYMIYVHQSSAFRIFYRHSTFPLSAKSHLSTAPTVIVLCHCMLVHEIPTLGRWTVILTREYYRRRHTDRDAVFTENWWGKWSERPKAEDLLFNFCKHFCEK